MRPPPPPKPQEQPFSVAIMIDGWMVRQRGMHWGVEPGAHAETKVLEVLHRYATDQREDYTVCMAAARVLGRFGHRTSCRALRMRRE